MIKVLVPIKQSNWLALSAAYFALEFAKRNPARIVFLLFPPGAGKGRPAVPGGSPAEWERRFTELLQRGRTENLPLELHSSPEAFLPAVVRFAREHHVSDIILALPSPQDDPQGRTLKMIHRLKHQIDCQIITVKPKEEVPMSA